MVIFQNIRFTKNINFICRNLSCLTWSYPKLSTAVCVNKRELVKPILFNLCFFSHSPVVDLQSFYTSTVKANLKHKVMLWLQILHVLASVKILLKNLKFIGCEVTYLPPHKLKKSMLTLQKAPMAHRQWSQEQFSAPYYTIKLNTMFNTSIVTAPPSLKTNYYLACHLAKINYLLINNLNTLNLNIFLNTCKISRNFWFNFHKYILYSNFVRIFMRVSGNFTFIKRCDFIYSLDYYLPPLRLL